MSTAPEPNSRVATSGVTNPKNFLSASDPEDLAFIVYKPPDATSAPTLNALPEDYFTMTTADIKAAQDTLSARSNALVNAPFQLRRDREADERKKMERWKNTTLRIKFGDRTQLQRVFPSTDKIRSVYEFVRSCFREDVKQKSFILYQSPPKRDFSESDPKIRTQSLAQLQLAPSSVLMLRFEDNSLNSSHVPAPLHPSILSRAVNLPRPPEFDTTATATSPSSTTKSTVNPNSSIRKDKVPKWLKFGHKK